MDLGLGKSIDEYIVATENHQDGTPHIHAFVKFQNKVEWKAGKFDLLGGLYKGDYKCAKSWSAVQAYCKKGGNFITNIDVESALQKRGKKNIAILTRPIPELIEEGIIGALQIPQAIKARSAYALLKLPEDKEACRGIWYYGPPGTGKSHRVRMAEPSLFLKAQNKWWDGYHGEVAVLLDDLDKGGSCLSHYMKIWTDKWACTGEFKGGTIPLNFDRFYVTSNYSPTELFGEDPIMLEAILRRFKVHHITNLKSLLKPY